MAGSARTPNKAPPELLPRGAAVRREALHNALALVDKPLGVSALGACQRLRAVSVEKARACQR